MESVERNGHSFRRIEIGTIRAIERGMTIYIHFISKDEQSVRLHNVERVESNGLHSIRVVPTFNAYPTVFSGVRNVAIEPDRD